VKFVFKASLALLAAATVVGQSWMHDDASPAELARIATISRECPSLAIETGRGRASKLDAALQRDAWWRSRIAAMIVGDDGCAAGRGEKR
jgi:hypothetical protein